MDQIALTQFLESFLQISLYSDYAPNGLQVEGNPSIERICTAVTASLEVIEQAGAMQADALIVHHGYFWKNEPAVITGMKAKRIKALMQYNLNLYGYHLPLDCHLTVGNNVLLGNVLNVEDKTPHTVGNCINLVWSGTFSKAHTFESCLTYLNSLFTHVQAVNAGKQSIQRIAWCTGAAQDYIEFAAQLGVDAFISGEISERTYYQAREMGVHYFACGHHATETRGVQALGEHLANQFHLEHCYLESENPY